MARTFGIEHALETIGCAVGDAKALTAAEGSSTKALLEIFARPELAEAGSLKNQEILRPFFKPGSMYDADKIVKIGEKYRKGVRELFDLPRTEIGLPAETQSMFSARLIQRRTSITGETPLEYKIDDENDRLAALNTGFMQMHDVGGKAIDTYTEKDLHKIALADLRFHHAGEMWDSVAAVTHGRVTYEKSAKGLYPMLGGEEHLSPIDLLEQRGRISRLEAQAAIDSLQGTRKYMQHLLEQDRAEAQKR